MKKIFLKTEFNRRYPDPLNKLDEENSINVEHHIVTCRAVDLPPDIPKDPNPRSQDTDKTIYKEVQKSLLNEADPSFHLKNKGITIIAHQVEYSPNRDGMEVYFKEGEGMVDGAHTYQIIQDNKQDCPANQFVKLEILTGIPKSYVEPIAQGLNTAVQVQTMSLANLGKRFEWIKAILDKTPFGKEIAYRENDDGEYTIRDVISFMTLFNVDLFADGSAHPKIAYTSKGSTLDLYLENQKSFEKMAPILKDILEFHDYVHLKGREHYNRVYQGKGGKLAFYQTRQRGKYKLVFTGIETQSKLYDGGLYPILGAFRYLVEQKPGSDSFSWKVGSLENVKKLFDKIGADIINSTKSTSDSRGRNPNAIGKDDTHWGNLYKTVALAYLEGNKK